MARTKAFDENTVLDKAVSQFWCSGYNGTSMQDLVDCLGINRSSMYDTYGDKHTLFIAALKRYRSQMAGAMIQTINESASIKETIRKLFDGAVAEALSDQSQRGCFMVNATVDVAPHDPEVAEIVRANRQDVEEAFCEAIQQAQERGEVSRHHDAMALSRFVFSAFNGIRVTAKSGAERAAYEDIIKVVLSVFE